MLSASTKATVRDPAPDSARNRCPHRGGIQVLEQRVTFQPYSRPRLAVDEPDAISQGAVAKQRGGVVEYHHFNFRRYPQLPR